MHTPRISAWDGLDHVPPVVDTTAADYKKYKASMKYFDFMALLAHGVGAIMVVLNGFVFGTANGGFQWKTRAFNETDPELAPVDGLLNYHLFFSTVAFVFLQGEAIVTYRIHRHEIKFFTKIVHSAFHLAVITVGGFSFAIMVHRNDVLKQKQFTSFYSWLEIALLAVYVIQMFGAFIMFVFPRTSPKVQQSVKPWHAGFGLLIFALSVIQVVSRNMTYSVGDCEIALNCSSHLDYLHNFGVISIIIYAVLIGILVVNPNWKRQLTLDERKVD
uniref:Cytochrome b561 domain-containing protein n=1 Tax=Panagrellus redivivus TaxID=6233 RepID=A0A7E4VHX3_PANRE